MLIIINDKEIDFELPKKDVKLKQVLDEVESFLFQVGKVPVSLAINDKDLTQEELDAREGETLKGDEKLHFGVISIFEFINANLDGAANANEELIKSITTFAEEIHSTEKTITSEQIVMELNHFFDFWFKLSKLIPEEFAKADFGGKTFDQIVKDLQGLFEESVKAMEGHDFVLAADLLQYEVVPVIESVHQSIPSLKDQVTATEEKAKRQEESQSKPAGVD